MRVPGVLFTCINMARGSSRGRGRGKKQQSQTASPARKRRKRKTQSSSEGCATSNEGNACSKQRAQKPSLTERRCEETYRKEE